MKNPPTRGQIFSGTGALKDATTRAVSPERFGNPADAARREGSRGVFRCLRHAPEGAAAGGASSRQLKGLRVLRGRRTRRLRTQSRRFCGEDYRAPPRSASILSSGQGFSARLSPVQRATAPWTPQAQEQESRPGRNGHPRRRSPKPRNYRTAATAITPRLRTGLCPSLIGDNKTAVSMPHALPSTNRALPRWINAWHTGRIGNQGNIHAGILCVILWGYTKFSNNGTQ